jgi:hypothetical protein
MRLHVAFKVVSQLDMAEDFMSLLPEELSLHDFLDEQIQLCNWLLKHKAMPHHCLKSLHSLRWMKSASHRRFYCILHSK